MHEYSDWPCRTQEKIKPSILISGYEQLELTNQAFRIRSKISIPFLATDVICEKDLMVGCKVIIADKSARERLAGRVPKHDEVVLTDRMCFTVTHHSTGSPIDDAARIARAIGRAYCLGLGVRDWKHVSKKMQDRSPEEAKSDENFTQAATASLMIPTHDLREALSYSENETFLRGYFRVPPHILLRKLYDLTKYDQARQDLKETTKRRRA